MTYVLTGENDYARRAARRKLVDAFVSKYSDVALEVIDGEEVELNRITEAISSLPFLASKKMVVLVNPGANKAFLEDFKNVLVDVPETTELIIDEPKFDKRSSYYKFCKKLEGFTEFNELDPTALQKWASEYVKKWEASLEPQAARALVDRTGANQFKLANELDKLCMYDSKITVDAVEQLTVKTPTSTIFELIDAAFSGNKERAIQLYDEQRALQVDPIQIVAMFTWQFHVLALVVAGKDRSTSDIAKEAKLNPYVVQKTSRLASSINLNSLKDHVHNLRTIDERMKSTRINSDDALKTFIISL